MSSSKDIAKQIAELQRQFEATKAAEAEKDKAEKAKAEKAEADLVFLRACDQAKANVLERAEKKLDALAKSDEPLLAAYRALKKQRSQLEAESLGLSRQIETLKGLEPADGVEALQRQIEVVSAYLPEGEVVGASDKNMLVDPAGDTVMQTVMQTEQPVMCMTIPKDHIAGTPLPKHLIQRYNTFRDGHGNTQTRATDTSVEKICRGCLGVLERLPAISDEKPGGWPQCSKKMNPECFALRAEKDAEEKWVVAKEPNDDPDMCEWCNKKLFCCTCCGKDSEVNAESGRGVGGKGLGAKETCDNDKCLKCQANGAERKAAKKAAKADKKPYARPKESPQENTKPKRYKLLSSDDE